jgi:hypothetical protein
MVIRGCVILLIASSSAIAVEVPNTIVVDGQTYNGVVYQSHDASRLRIMHDTGLAALPLADLPADLREKLGYDEKEAAEAEAVFSAQQAAVQSQQQKALADQAENKKRLALAKEIEDRGVAVVANVFQVVDGGVLVDSSISTLGLVQSVVSANNLLHPDRTKTITKEGVVRRRLSKGDHVFIQTLEGGLVDGGEYSGKIYPIGTHSYTTALGAARTVAAFTDIPAVAARYYGLE